MSLFRQMSVGLLVVGGLLPVQAEACWLFGGCGNAHMGRAHSPYGVMVPPSRRSLFVPPIGTTMPPMGDCNCGTPAPMMMPEQAPLLVPQTTMHPLMDNCMCPQQVTTCADVPRMVTRREAIQVQVPTTLMEQVTVDEGGFQQVWVPRMVTRQVPRTVMQTQTQYRDVATQITERVPQLTTQWGPGLAGQHFPQGGLGSACETAIPYNNSDQPQPIATPLSITPIPEDQPISPVPEPVDAQRTAPQSSQAQEWQTVRQRQAIEQQSYQEYNPGYRVPQAAGRFSSPAR